MRLSFPLSPLIPSLFFAFRLVYIPASILSHTGHGLPWLTAIAALVATFGMEALARRGLGSASSSRGNRDKWLVILALLLLGLFPEEAPVGLILWAAIGAAWGRQGHRTASHTHVAGAIAGGLLGVSGLFGPGSWLMAGVLAFWVWHSTGDYNSD